MRKYAQEICGADFKFLSDPLQDNMPPFFGIFAPFTGPEPWCHEYDSVCFVDSDMMATTTARNIFDHVSDTAVSAHLLRKGYRGTTGDYLYWYRLGGHFNSGTVVFPRAVYEPLIEFCKTLKDRHDNRPQVANDIGGYDQAQVNFFIKEQDAYHKLDNEFNYHLTAYHPKDRFKASIIHYHRRHKSRMREEYNNDRILK